MQTYFCAIYRTWHERRAYRRGIQAYADGISMPWRANPYAADRTIWRKTTRPLARHTKRLRVAQRGRSYSREALAWNTGYAHARQMAREQLYQKT